MLSHKIHRYQEKQLEEMAFVLPTTASSINFVWLKAALIFSIFICQGMKSDLKRLSKFKSCAKAIIIAILASQLIAPLIAFILISSLNWHDDYAYGIMLMSCTGCTIASGIIISEQAKADLELAILITVILSLISVLIIPINLSWTMKSSNHNSGIFLDLLIKLSLYILLPWFIGQVIKTILHERIVKLKHALKVLPIVSLAILVFISIGSHSQKISSISFDTVLVILAASLSIHYATMLTALLVSKVASLNFSESKAIAILSSQKTLPVAITVWVTQFSDKNFVLSIIIFHLSQILGDSLLAKRWAKSTKSKLEKDSL